MQPVLQIRTQRKKFFVSKKKNFWVEIEFPFIERVAPKGLNFILTKKNFEKELRFSQDLGSKISDLASQNCNFGKNWPKRLGPLLERVAVEGLSCL